METVETAGAKMVEEEAAEVARDEGGGAAKAVAEA